MTPRRKLNRGRHQRLNRSRFREWQFDRPSRRQFDYITAFDRRKTAPPWPEVATELALVTLILLVGFGSALAARWALGLG
jgi:hypothetical protein